LDFRSLTYTRKFLQLKKVAIFALRYRVDGHLFLKIWDLKVFDLKVFDLKVLKREKETKGRSNLKATRNRTKNETESMMKNSLKMDPKDDMNSSTKKSIRKMYMILFLIERSLFFESRLEKGQRKVKKNGWKERMVTS
jgi:hypothetical protein